MMTNPTKMDEEYESWLSTPQFEQHFPSSYAFSIPCESDPQRWISLEPFQDFKENIPGGVI